MCKKKNDSMFILNCMVPVGQQESSTFLLKEEW